MNTRALKILATILFVCWLALLFHILLNPFKYDDVVEVLKGKCPVSQLREFVPGPKTKPLIVEGIDFSKYRNSQAQEISALNAIQILTKEYGLENAIELFKGEYDSGAWRYYLYFEDGDAWISFEGSDPLISGGAWRVNSHTNPLPARKRNIQ